jgi:hypothetical protein
MGLGGSDPVFLLLSNLTLGIHPTAGPQVELLWVRYGRFLLL